MRGYGSPSGGDGSVFGMSTTVAQDWGYGDPSSGIVNPDYLDLGYGSIRPSRYHAVVLNPGLSVMPDDGGVLIQLRMGQWPGNDAVRGSARSGPFLVRCVNSATGDVYPKDMFGCHAGRVGKEWECETDLRHEILSFALPPLPPAEYDFTIGYGGAGFPHTITVPRAIRVIYRGRSSVTFAGREALPTRFSAGARSPRLTDLQGK
jgi:hypothetical protein